MLSIFGYFSILLLLRQRRKSEAHWVRNLRFRNSRSVTEKASLESLIARSVLCTWCFLGFSLLLLSESSKFGIFDSKKNAQALRSFGVAEEEEEAKNQMRLRDRTHNRSEGAKSRLASKE
uniref:Uncharacterized protein n=1 Tax=Pediastrum angulosum TaxID=271408 RepID=A0A2U8GIA1_9CHLO|nr:hypothetical protein [Pediastrum angulosum]AWI68171.1 hypothetical protein [Pediastrum angulosum]